MSSHWTEAFLGVIASGAYLLSGAFWTLLALWLSGQREAGDMDAGA